MLCLKHKNERFGKDNNVRITRSSVTALETTDSPDISASSCSTDKTFTSEPGSIMNKIKQLLQISDEVPQDVNPNAILKAITFLSEVYDDLVFKIKTKNTEISGLSRRVEELENSLSMSDTGIQKMTSKLELLDQENRKMNIVLTGLNVKSFSSAVQGDGQRDPLPEEQSSMQDKIVKFAEVNDITIDKNDIESIILLHNRANPNGPQRTLIRFNNHATQQQFYEMRFKLKNSFPGVYVNEDLTRDNADLFKRARELRRNHKILSTWTKNCVIYVKTIPTSNRPSRYLTIKTREDIAKLQN